MITPVDLVRLHHSLKNEGIFKPSIAIVGFSSNGMLVGSYAKKAGFKVMGVSDESCGIVDLSGNGGLDVDKLIELKKEVKEFKNLKLKDILKTKPEFLHKIEVDVLIVGELEKELAEEVRAKIVLQYDKGMISREASRILKTKQVPVLHFEAA